MDISTGRHKSDIHTWIYPWISISTASLWITHLLRPGCGCRLQMRLLVYTLQKMYVDRTDDRIKFCPASIANCRTRLQQTTACRNMSSLSLCAKMPLCSSRLGCSGRSIQARHPASVRCDEWMRHWNERTESVSHSRVPLYNVPCARLSPLARLAAL